MTPTSLERFLGGLAMLGAGVYLVVAGEHQVGGALVGAAVGILTGKTVAAVSQSRSGS